MLPLTLIYGCIMRLPNLTAVSFAFSGKTDIYIPNDSLFREAGVEPLNLRLDL